MISDLKKVPHNWQKVKFAEIAEIVNDRIDKPKESGLQYYIGLEHLDTDEIRIKRYGSTSDVEATKFLCKKGDIIFGKRNSYLRKVAISDRDAVVSAHSMVLRPKGDKIVSRFLPCFMQSTQFWKTAQAISEGSMSPTIKWKTLADQEFWLPDISNQGTIANILWTLEESLERTEKLIETTKILKYGLMQRLFTKGIRHTKFKKTQFGSIPEEWNIVKLEKICNKIIDGTHLTPNYTKEGIPFLRITDIQQEKIDWDKVKKISLEEHKLLTRRCKPEKGDVLLSKNGTVGITKIVDWERPFSIFVSLCLIKPNHATIKNSYLKNILQSDVCFRQIKIRSKQGTVTNLHLEEIRELLIPLPTLEEQNEISSILLKVAETLTHLKGNLKVKSQLKKRLTNEMLSGTIFDFMRVTQ